MNSFTDFITKYKIYDETVTVSGDWDWDWTKYFLVFLPAKNLVGFITEEESCSYYLDERYDYDYNDSDDVDAQMYYYNENRDAFMTVDEMKQRVDLGQDIEGFPKPLDPLDIDYDIKVRASRAFLDWYNLRT